jgi:hypothetical protein
MRDEIFRTPEFIGPADLEVLGDWVTEDIQLVPYDILEAIDLVRLAQANPDADPEELSGNAFAATIGPQGVTIENHFVEDMQGEFSLGTVLDVLLDFWDYCVPGRPRYVAPAWERYVKESGRDPLAGLRQVTN